MKSAGVLLISPRRRVLLCLRSDTRVWATPAGHIERGEEPWQAAVRELHEETGFVGELSNFRPVRRIGRFALFAAETQEFRPKLDHEHLKAGWFRLDDLPQPLHRRLRTVLG